MYLEISNIAAACGKNPYESREKMLLISWARHCPIIVKEYLINNKCIVPLIGEDYSDIQKRVYSDVLPDEFDTKDFNKIEKKVVNEYKKVRNNEQSDLEIEKLIKKTQDSLKKDNGTLQEKNIIIKEDYVKGNNKMYYYNVDTDYTIGGKHDALDGNLLLEIKTRVKKQNVRRNEYDLYQLIGYLLALNVSQGKIIQLYNKIQYDSNDASEIEYGLVDISKEPWSNLVNNIKINLINYFDELKILINKSNYIYLDKIIPGNIRPIAYLKEEQIVDENIKFKNLIRFF